MGVELGGTGGTPNAPPPPPAPPGRAGRTPEQIALERLIVRSAVRVALSVLGLGILVLLAWRLRLILLLIAVAAFIAFLLEPVVAVLTRRGMRRAPAVGLVYVLLVLAGAGIGYLIFHPVISQATHFAKDLPTIVQNAEHGRGPVGRLVTRLHLQNYVATNAPHLQNAITKLGKPALTVGKTVLSGVAGAVTIGFTSFFLLLQGPNVAESIFQWVSDDRAAFLRRVINRMVRQVAGFMLGDFATSIVAGVAVFIALVTTGVPFAGVLAIWVALVDFLPLVGGLLAGVPTIAIAFLHSITAGVVTTVVFLVYQQIENHVLYPLIVARTVQLNSLLVLLAVLLGAEIGNILGSTFGAMAGAIFAVPIAGVAQLTAVEVLAARRARRVTTGVLD